MPKSLAPVILAIAMVSVAGAGAAPSDVQLPVAQALESYARKPDGAIAGDLTQRDDVSEILRRYRDVAEGWIKAARDGERTHRQHVAVALAMEILAETVDGPVGNYNDARPLIEWGCALLQREPRSEFERRVYLVSVAVLQGTGDYRVFGDPDPAVKRPGHIDHAMKRFPEDDQLRLAQVLARNETRLIATRAIGPGDLVTGARWQFTAGGGRGGGGGTVETGAARLSETFRLLAALEGPLVRDEATLRRGVLQFLVGQSAAASRDLGMASASSTPFISYLANLTLGALYYQTGDAAAAVARYSRAASILPATSARLGLATALLREGRSQDSAEITEAWAADDRVEDPWRIYSLGLFHELGNYLAMMRASLP